MERQQIVARLKGLREELETDGVLEDLTVTLLLSDVGSALGLSESEQAEVLGPEATKAVEEWKATVWWPTTEEEETATVPLPGLAAVPA